MFPAWTASAPARSYLMAYNGSTSFDTANIGLAESWDGITWTKITNSDGVLIPSQSWASSFVARPMLLKFGATDYRMWFDGGKGSVGQIGYATSSNGLVWTLYGSNPVLPNSGSGWDAGQLQVPVVFYEPSDVSRPYKMWYGASSTYGGALIQIGYAYSTDGVTWTKSSANPVMTVGAGGSYDAVCVYPGAITKVGSTYYLFYSGRPNTGGNPCGDEMCLATFTDPEGTYTKSASNRCCHHRRLSTRSPRISPVAQQP